MSTRYGRLPLGLRLGVMEVLWTSLASLAKWYHLNSGGSQHPPPSISLGAKTLDVIGTPPYYSASYLGNREPCPIAIYKSTQSTPSIRSAHSPPLRGGTSTPSIRSAHSPPLRGGTSTPSIRSAHSPPLRGGTIGDALRASPLYDIIGVVDMISYD